jgi:hypothetical protein
MIAIQTLLVIAFLALTYFFLSSRNSSRTKAWKKILLLLLIVGAIFFVLFPDYTTNLANLVGVGRGTDLLVYILAVAFIFQLLNGYVKTKQEEQRLVALARKVAIIDANMHVVKKSG